MIRVLRCNVSKFAIVMLVTITALFAWFLISVVIWPAYQKPSNRMYNSRFGYAALRRATDQPFVVKTASVQLRKIAIQRLGEGRITAMPVRVPIIPTDKILSVHVEEGQRVTKGELLAELDPTLAQLRVESATLLVRNAQAELERVKLGSTHTLVRERPELDGINLAANQKQIEILRERHAAMLSLHDQGAASRFQLLEIESKLAEAKRDLQSSEFGLDMSSKGQLQSTSIAENNLKQQQNLCQQRQAELDNYRIVAPADGIVSSVQIRSGEYNRTSGEVGFVIAAGLWFEAHVDQTAIHDISVGSKAQVQLEALPGDPIIGAVSRVVPIVTYTTGGPEGSRPVRALGMGAPEWPTTFSVIVEFSSEEKQRLVPGLTGFARIEEERKVAAVPLSAVTTLSARQGAVTVIANDERTNRKVTLGASSEGWVEIKQGLAMGERVAVAGYEDLSASDQFKEVAAMP